MESITLIHTVKSVVTGFDDSLRNCPGYEMEIHNLWGDFLANSPNEVGESAIQNRNRLLYNMEAQGLTGVDIIVTTCPTLIPAMELIRPFIRVPVIAIDDAMARRSVLYGKRIMVMVAAENTVGSTVPKIKAKMGRAGRGVDMSTCVYMDAFHAVKAIDMKEHDMILREKARELRGYNCIVLAQASMAHLEDETASIIGCSALTSPRPYTEEIKNKLEGIQR